MTKKKRVKKTDCVRMTLKGVCGHSRSNHGISKYNMACTIPDCFCGWYVKPPVEKDKYKERR